MLIAFVYLFLLVLALLLNEPVALLVYSSVFICCVIYPPEDINAYLPKQTSKVQQPFKSAKDNQEHSTGKKENPLKVDLMH